MPELTDDITAAAPTGLTRRTALRVAAVSGAGAALLAACGGGGDDGGTAATNSPAAGSESPTGTADGDGGTGSGGGGSGGGLVATADVPVGGGVILEDDKIVVTQPTEGSFKAFTAVCTHQACLVGSVKNGVISCPCHGSRYSAEDGSVENGPATQPLKEIRVTVEGDQVVEA